MNSTYSKLLQKLLSINLHGGIKFGLQNSLRLDNLLKNPSQAFPSVHVAGTNGKGSVVTKIASALQCTRLRVGLYTSPHIACFRERIRVNGQMIPEKHLCGHLKEIFKLTEEHGIPATFFEISTLAAFSYFAEQDIDIAVIETGLGGRLDATNIVRSCLSVITSISFDHTEILGNTLEDIAREKAGIIKPRVPVVIGPRVPTHVIQEAARQLESPCIRVDGRHSDYHAENESIARKALELLKVSPSAIALGISALPPCRLETIYAGRLALQGFQPPLPIAVILDVAHNPDGIKHLLEAIGKRFPKYPLRFVIGLSKNKDIESCLKLLKEEAAHFHLVEACNGRAASREDLLNILLKLGVFPDTMTCEESIQGAVENAIAQAGKRKEIVVVCGTFFIMSAARSALGIHEPQDPEDMNERTTS